jgi:hypothetical protein
VCDQENGKIIPPYFLYKAPVKAARAEEKYEKLRDSERAERRKK